MSTETPTTIEWCREAARRIHRGTGRLTLLLARRISRRGAAHASAAWGSIRRWVGAASGFVDWALRVGLLLLAAGLARKVLAAAAPALADRVDSLSWLMWPAAVVWVVAAYRVGHEDWRPPVDEDEQKPKVEPVDGQGAEPAGPPVLDRDRLVAALHEVGAPHAQFVPLAERLGTTTARVREACEKHRIPTRDGVRMRGRSTAAGVARPDFPPFPSPTGPAPGGVVAAGQANNNNDNNGLVVERGEGMTIIREPAETASRHTALKKP
ncbi:hypothetical protein [Streptomyces pini]|uniref:Uncharacterized protein n=1 Tax=Streptomyces pini TaxID=1520580 RepID=A0A1I4C0U8_9ACTN|nr:hypothetical protein [Streptomyces pini]SFK73826.1 hypothetical protein SAMN05192584_108188 [Streptomyces pini]